LLHSQLKPYTFNYSRPLHGTKIVNGDRTLLLFYKNEEKFYSGLIFISSNVSMKHTIVYIMMWKHYIVRNWQKLV